MAAINPISKNFACERANDGIRVNSVCPGWTHTPLAALMRWLSFSKTQCFCQTSYSPKYLVDKLRLVDLAKTLLLNWLSLVPRAVLGNYQKWKLITIGSLDHSQWYITMVLRKIKWLGLIYNGGSQKSENQFWCIPVLKKS